MESANNTSGKPWRGHADWRDARLREKKQRQSERQSERQQLLLSQKRYPLNLFLLLVCAFLYIVWFYRHINAFLLQSLVVGVPLSLWAIWKLLQGFFPSGLQLDQQSLVSRLFSTRRTTTYLVALVLFALFLLATTTSVYLEHSGGPEEFTVEVWRLADKDDEDNKTELYMRRMTVSSVDKTKGHPVLFDFASLFSSRKLELRVIKPFGYKLEPFALKPWTGHYSTAEFATEELWVIRLVPSGKNLLGTSEKTLYRIRITVDGALATIKGNGTNPFFITPRQCIYIGENIEAISRVIEAESEATRDTEIKQFLLRVDPPAWRSALMDFLPSTKRIIETSGIRGGANVRIDLLAVGVPEPRDTKCIPLDERGGITTRNISDPPDS